MTTEPSPADPAIAYIGIVPGEVQVPPFEVELSLDRVGGPSAGLMFALGIVDKLTAEQENGGKHVAGTGTIDADGTVGPDRRHPAEAARRAGRRRDGVPGPDGELRGRRGGGGRRAAAGPGDHAVRRADAGWPPPSPGRRRQPAAEP